MNKLFLILFCITGISLTSCSGPSEDSDKKDSLEAARAADSMIQNQLNSDTSMNTDSTIDNMPTDSMPKGTNNR